MKIREGSVLGMVQLVVAMFLVLGFTPAWADYVINENGQKVWVADGQGQEDPSSAPVAQDPPPEGASGATSATSGTMGTRPRFRVEGNTVIVGDGQDKKKEENPFLGYVSLSVGLGLYGVTHAGEEDAFNSVFVNAALSMRYWGWKVGKDTYFQPGIRLTAEGTSFESNYYRGTTQRYMAGLELALFKLSSDARKLPLDWSITLRPTIGFDHEEGRSRTGDGYRMRHQDTTVWGVDGMIEYFGWFIETDRSVSRWIEPVQEGWIPRIAALFTVVQPLHDTRSSTAGEPPSWKEHWRLTIRTMIYQWSYPLGIWSVGVDVGGAWYYTAGYRSEPDDSATSSTRVGVALNFELHPRCWLYFVGNYDHEWETDRGSVTVTGNVEVLKW
ncbi:MAG: hypothetical protein HY461_00310 [Parcubacteria group bacterium]|nr:hypothetical protein [Parcubacteria group bacterium]